MLFCIQRAEWLFQPKAQGLVQNDKTAKSQMFAASSASAHAALLSLATNSASGGCAPAVPRRRANRLERPHLNRSSRPERKSCKHATRFQCQHSRMLHTKHSFMLYCGKTRTNRQTTGQDQWPILSGSFPRREASPPAFPAGLGRAAAARRVPQAGHAGGRPD